MKHTLLLALAAATAITAQADLSSNGYYRVENYKTKRYISIIDNRGQIDLANTTADLQAIQLQKNFDEVCCDPASILYVTHKSGGQYQIEAQGTGIHQIIDHYVNLKTSGKADGQTLYEAYGELNGLVKYLGDAEFFPTDLGTMGTNAKGDYTKWYIMPVEATGENYFGVRPTVTAGGKNYQTHFASFPYTAYSSGIKSYYVVKTDNGMAVIKEINGTVPANTPVIIECPSTNPSGNKLNVGGSASAVTGNILKGVYFNNPLASHLNQTAYNKNTMRVLGKCADGSLGFIKSETLDFIPKNTCYITVPAGSAPEFKCVTEAQYDEYLKTIPKSLALTPATAKMYVGESVTVSADFTPSTVTDKTLVWTSSNTSVATVANGKVTGASAGTATVTATTWNGIKASMTVTVEKKPVVPTSITIDPVEVTLAPGEYVLMQRTVLPYDAPDRTVTWSNTAPGVAHISTGGVLTGVAPGTAVITATTVNGLKASCNVTVRLYEPTSLKLTPEEKTLHPGEKFTIASSFEPAANVEKSLTWTTSDASVAGVSQDGTVTALKEGKTTITAKTINGLASSCVVTVMLRQPSSISLEPGTAELHIGDELALVASLTPAENVDSRLTWTSSDGTVAAVDATGRVKAMALGSTVITVQTCNGLTAKCMVTVSPVIPSAIVVEPSAVTLTQAMKKQLSATVYPENATDRSVVWESSDSDIVACDGTGKITARKEGVATVTATTVNGLKATCEVTVNRNFIEVTSITLDYPSIAFKENEEFTLKAEVLPENASDKSVYWSVDDESVATVTRGVVKAISVGKAVVTARASNGMEATCEVEVQKDLSGIDDITGPDGKADVYDLLGRLVAKDADSSAIRCLANGIYIVNGHKVRIE